MLTEHFQQVSCLDQSQDLPPAYEMQYFTYHSINNAFEKHDELNNYGFAISGESQRNQKPVEDPYEVFWRGQF